MSDKQYLNFQLQKINNNNNIDFRYQGECCVKVNKKMASKMKVIFELNTNQGSRIKQIAMHPVKDWIGIINQNNTFSLWNFQQKILIKSFSCNTLDDNKIVQIKQIVFYDKHSLYSIQECKNMKNNIIFVTNTKLIFYDYITDSIKQTSQKDFDQKSIRKVCIYSQNKICIAMNDGSFKVLDTKENQSKGSMSIRTVKGYHNKPIAWIFSYSQNYNQMPRVITASDSDGSMACWNIDMILKSPINNQFCTPCFKFQSTSKKTKQSIINQQILSLQYDPSSYRLITVNEQWIRLWSTMTGMQVKRIKNTYKYKQIIFFNHFTYTNQCFAAHSKNSKLMTIRNNNGNICINNEIQLRNFFPGNYTNNPQQQMQLLHIYSLPYHPSNIFLITNFNMAVLQIDKFYIPPFGYHPCFYTKLSTINSRDMINKIQGQLRKNITLQQINNIKFQQDILINTFYLSVEQQFIYFNLIEIQYDTMLCQTRKYKIYTFQQLSPFRLSQGGRSIILVNFQGNQIIVYNKLLSYYQIYTVYNEHESKDLLNQNEIQNKIDYYSKFIKIGSGYCRDICYHQYKNQYIIIAAYDQKDRQIQYKISKQKKGIFKGKQTQIKLQLNGQPTKYKIHIYNKIGKQYKLIQKSDYYITKLYKIYNFGSFFGYSVTKGTFQLIDFICSQKNTSRQIDGILNSPQQVYISYCQSYYILSYDKYFIVFKVQQNGCMSYFRTFEYTLLHGYFWQKFFFFLTQNSLYFLHILNEDSIIIKIADISKINIIQKVIDDIQDDDFQSEYQLLPAGQQQIISIINMNIILLNQIGNPTMINLQGFPYIVFCLQISSGVTDQSVYLYKNASKNIGDLMKEALTNYGMIAPDLMG